MLRNKAGLDFDHLNNTTGKLKNIELIYSRGLMHKKISCKVIFQLKLLAMLKFTSSYIVIDRFELFTIYFTHLGKKLLEKHKNGLVSKFFKFNIWKYFDPVI